MTRREPWGLLLIGGCMTHQENYARAFAADPRCRVVGLTDMPDVPLQRQSLNLKLAAELDLPFLPDWKTALQQDDVDFVSVCVEPERRADAVIACARAGKHVYVDKPMATSVADAQRMVDEIHSAGVLSQMFSLVRSGVARRARTLLDSGRLGTLQALHCELLFAKGPAGTATLGQPRRETAHPSRFTFRDSKRELFCVGLYPLVLIPWLTGERFCRVTAVTANYFFGEHQCNDVEDFASLLLETEHGLQVTITVGRTGWHSHRHHGVHQLQLIGTQSAELVDAHRPRLEMWADAPPWTGPQRDHPQDPMGFWSSTQREAGIRPREDWWPVDGPIQSDASYFLDCLTTGTASDVPVELGAHAVAVIMAGYKSAATGRTIALPQQRPV